MAESMAIFEIFKDKKKEWRWHLRHFPTKNIVADSAEGYKNKADAINGFMSVMKHGPGAISEYLGKFMATFELYKDKRKEWRWRLRHQNGNIIADSGEGYKNRLDAINGLESVKKNAPAAPIVELEKHYSLPRKMPK